MTPHRRLNVTNRQWRTSARHDIHDFAEKKRRDCSRRYQIADPDPGIGRMPPRLI